MSLKSDTLDKARALVCQLENEQWEEASEMCWGIYENLDLIIDKEYFDANH